MKALLLHRLLLIIIILILPLLPLKLLLLPAHIRFLRLHPHLLRRLRWPRLCHLIRDIICII